MRHLYITCFVAYIFGVNLGSSVVAQIANPYQAYFDEAYATYQGIPEGVLEAVAYNNTRMKHLVPDPEDASCQGIPAYFGVMGLVEDGKGYFRNTLEVVARSSSYAPEQIKQDPRTNILAYAEAYSRMQSARFLVNRSVALQGDVLADLSEIPDDNSLLNRYARDQQFFSVLKEMENPHTGRRAANVERFNYQEIFPDPVQYNMLTAPSVRLETDRPRRFSLNNSPFRCTSEERVADYDGAVWQAANTRNYGSRSGEPVKEIAIHTIQGTYASAISWFKNPNARVSTHYVIRASDGQVTQMVCESDKAFHIKTDNATSIGIEHEGYIADGASWYSEEMYKSSARLVQDLAARHGIDPLQMYSGPPTEGIRTLSNACYRIKGHQHFRNNNHVDPGPYWDWEYYYQLINGAPEVQPITDASGSIGLRNYDENVRKAYRIDPPGNTPLKLEFTQFDLEGSANEPFDFILLYDGAGPDGRFLGRYSGNRKPAPMMANSGMAYIEFRSDCRVNAKGFSLKYAPANIDLDCSPLSSATVVETFALGATVGWQAGGTGNYVVKVRQQNEDEAWTQFPTKESQFQLTGLAANSTYDWEVHSVCPSGQVSPPVGGTIRTNGVGRAGNPQIYIITAEKGEFTDSGGKERGYANNEAYIYSIRAKEAGIIKADFSQFDTEEKFDVLTVYDGKGTDSPLLGTFSGNQRPRNIQSTGNSLTFKFVSDNRTQGNGWHASWQLIKRSGPAPEDPSDPPPIVMPVTDALEPVLKFPDRLPTTDIRLNGSYTESNFEVEFQDESGIGRNPAYRFFTVVQQEGAGWVAQEDRGFLWEEFSGNLEENWTGEVGTWRIDANQLVQADPEAPNTNLWREFRQERSNTYLYHWVARMQGSSNNKRMGLHFFVSDPSKDQRGDSYFVWFRDAASGDKAEIYKTTNNRFDKKIDNRINLVEGQAYDFKVIYQPSSGRIEAYINNEFAVSWRDPKPLKSGKAVSLRTGNTLVTLDNFRVYKGRSSEVQLTAGKAGKSDIVSENIVRGGQRFRVYSVIADPRSSRETARWSQVTMMESRILPGERDVPEEEERPEVPTGELNLRPAYSGDFILSLPEPGYFILPTYYDQKLWKAPTHLGYFFEDFRGSKFREGWIPLIGTWKQENGRLLQSDESASNANISTIIDQRGGDVLLYHWQTKLLTKGENKRFGMHFFASDGYQTNRGDSYLVWFRNYDQAQDKVEIYKSFKDQLNQPLAEGEVDIQPNTWYDIKVYLNSGRGMVWVYIDDQLVLSWQDLTGAFSKGAYVSFRTGNAAVQVDNFRMYKQFPVADPIITVGRKETDMIRFQSGAKEKPVSLYAITLGQDGNWTPILTGETKIR